MTDKIILEMEDLRQVAAFAAESAAGVLEIYEGAHPADPRPREAVEAARTFASGGRRVKALRDTAWATHKAAQESESAAASQAARAAMCAASAAFLHPLADPHQIKHILGAAAYAARATELIANDDPDVGADHAERTARGASPMIAEVLGRFPAAPAGGGRVGELLRLLDRTVRGGNS